MPDHVWVVCGFVFLLGLSGCQPAQQPASGTSDKHDLALHQSEKLTEEEMSQGPGQDEQALREFQLTDQQGRPFESRSLEGKIWVGSIFFADCPSVCRTQNQRISELHREFKEQGVEFVSITCDPANDTPQRLAEYSQLFNADPQSWHFLTGDMKLIERIGNEMFNIVVAEEVHSDRLVIFDRSGKIVGSYRSQDRDEFLKARVKLKELLASGTSS